MIILRKLFILISPFLFVGIFQVHAEETSCYVSVYIKEKQKEVSKLREEILVEVEIDMRYQSNIQKNWNSIAKELGYSNVKKMIEAHKNHKNWDSYQNIFNNPAKYDKGKFLKKIDKVSLDPLLTSEIAISLISKYFAEVIAIPPAGISNDACIYNVQVNNVEETMITTITSDDLNANGESKKTGVDGIKESILSALFTSLEDKRIEICDNRGSVLNKECALLLAEAEIEKNECWLEISTETKNKTNFKDKKLVAEISTSLISQYLVDVKYFEKSQFEKIYDSQSTEEKKEFDTKIEQILLSNECLYKVYPKVKDDTIIITFSGPDLNAYGNSKQQSADGLQEAMLMALYRSLKDKRNKICQDYGNILVDQCKNQSTSFEKQDAKFRIRGFVHNYEGSNYNLSNISYLFTMKDWGFWPSVLSNGGIGQSFLNFESTSSSGAELKASVTSLDISKTYVIESGPKNTLNKLRSVIMDLLPINSTSGEWFIIPGMGVVFPNIIPIPIIYGGELDINSQYGTFSTEKAFGYSFFGNLGMEIGEWEMLLGLRWSKVEFSDIKASAKNFVFSGTSFMFGLGWGF